APAGIDVAKTMTVRGACSYPLQPCATLPLTGHLGAGVELMDPGNVMQRTLERAEPGVASIGVVAIGEMQDVRSADRRVLNFAGAAAAQHLVARDRVRDRARACLTQALS